MAIRFNEGRIERIPKMSEGRHLTEGEIELAREVYGDSINYDEVIVYEDEKWQWFILNDRVHAPDGNIYYPTEADYYDDFSELDTNADGMIDAANDNIVGSNKYKIAA